MDGLEASYERRLPPRVPPESTQPSPQKLVDYHRLLEELSRLEKSGRVKIFSGGLSHEKRVIRYLAISDQKNIARISLIQSQIKQSCPCTEFKTLSRFTIRNSEPRPEEMPSVVMLHAATYGFEAAHTEALLKVASTLAFSEEEAIQEILSKVIVIVVPMMNPDGRQMALGEWSGKPLCPGSLGAGNKRGAILNRDFIQMAEPETKVVHEIYDEWQPCAAYDPHEDMMFLGVNPDWPELCWCPPFADPLHPYVAEETLREIDELSREIALRWRASDISYRSSIDGKEPLLSFLSSESFGVHFSLHGTPVVITESARTPGTNTWEERIEQKSEAALAFLSRIARLHPKLARSRHELLLRWCRSETSSFVIPLSEGSQEDMLVTKMLIQKLKEHSVQAFFALEPLPACLIPLNQPSRALILDLLDVNLWNPWQLAAAYGVRVVRLEETGFKKEYSQARLGQVSDTAFSRALKELEPNADTYLIPNTFQGIRLANMLINAGEEVFWALEDFIVRSVRFRAGTFLSRTKAALQDWVGVLYRTSFPAVRSTKLGRKRIALYDGVGVDGMNARHRADFTYALDAMGFEYELASPESIRSSPLSKYDIVVIPNGNAHEILKGTDTSLGWQRSPWEVTVENGLEAEGIEKLRQYVHNGGTYLGIGCGGAALASAQISGLTSVKLSSLGLQEGKHMYGAGTARVRIKLTSHDNPIAFGLPEEFYAHYHSDPLLLKYNEILFLPSQDHLTVAVYRGVDTEKWTNLWHRPGIFDKGHGAVVLEGIGEGASVLVGFDPVFGARWFSTYRLVSNSIHSSGMIRQRLLAKPQPFE